MPFYLFECKECNVVYEEFTRWDETGEYKDVACPKCGSKKKEKRATCCNFMFSNPEGTDRWNSDSTGHDYRYKTKQKETREERENAQKKSHMGGTDEIYKKYDDLNKDKNWDFDKI